MRPKPDEFAVKLRQTEALTGLGMPLIDAILGIVVTEQSGCRRKKNCGGMQVWRYGLCIDLIRSQIKGS